MRTAQHQSKGPRDILPRTSHAHMAPCPCQVYARMQIETGNGYPCVHSHCSFCTLTSPCTHARSLSLPPPTPDNKQQKEVPGRGKWLLREGIALFNNHTIRRGLSFKAAARTHWRGEKWAPDLMQILLNYYWLSLVSSVAPSPNKVVFVLLRGWILVFVGWERDGCAEDGLPVKASPGGI